MSPLQQAKWKRAEELVGEAGDMDPGDAALMFVIAAIMSQKKYYDEIVRKTLDGEVVHEVEHLQDLEMFRVVKHIIGPAAHAKARDHFLESALYAKNRNDAVVRSMTDAVHRLTLALMLKEELEKKGGSLYDV